jgi:apolipoprotein N-acyltransferase
LVACLVGLGLIFQLAQRWVSVAGDVLWLVAVLLFAVAAAVEPKPRANGGLAIAAASCFVLAGLAAAVLMVYWILVDSGQVNRSGDLYLTVPVVVLAALGIVGRVVVTRKAGRILGRSTDNDGADQ